MSISLMATDYSRPLQPFFEQPSYTASIHSTFQRAANIALGDILVALLSDELPRMPNSVRLPSAVMRRLLLGLRPGMKVCIGDGKLDIPACNISILLPSTPAWEPRPPLAQFHWHREAMAQHIHRLACSLTERPWQDGLAPLLGPLLLRQPMQETALTRRAFPLLYGLVRASIQQNREGIKEAARGLAGLGPGLTPAGDDALGGFAAVMVLTGANLAIAREWCQDIAHAIAETAAPATTMLSAVLLKHAARGEVGEHVGEMLLALLLPETASGDVLRAAERLLSFGATSGADTLVGMLLGLSVCIGFDDMLEGGRGDDIYGK